jgi:hypothetical protein
LDHLDSINSELPELGHVLGFHTTNFFEDQLHADALGLRQHACGSCLRDLCDAGHFGPLPAGPGKWQEKLDAQLQRATLEFHRWLADSRLSSTQAAFRTLGLTLKRQDDSACLKAKGKNCITVSQWLLSKTRQISAANPTDLHDKMRVALFLGLDGIWDVPHRIRPRFELTVAEADELESHRLCARSAMYSLHRDAQMRGAPAYNLTPKYHQTDELCRRSSRTRVAAHLFWCFRAEDHMGKLAQIMYRTHGATSKRRVLELWLIDFWIWLEGSDAGDFASASVVDPV